MLNNPSKQYKKFICREYGGDESLMINSIIKLADSINYANCSHLARDVQRVRLMLQLIRFSGFNAYLTLNYKRHMQCVGSLYVLINEAWPNGKADNCLEYLLASKLLSILIDARPLELL